MSSDDRGAIIDVINRYGLMIDTKSWPLFGTIFTEDVEADYGTRRWSDAKSFRGDFESSHSHLITQHAMLNHLVSVDGDRADAFTYCSWRLISRTHEGGDHLTGTAWYDDKLVRGAKGWLIRRRECRILWWEGNVMVTQEPGKPLREFQGSTSLRQKASDGAIGYLNRLLATADDGR